MSELWWVDWLVVVMDTCLVDSWVDEKVVHWVAWKDVLWVVVMVVG